MTTYQKKIINRFDEFIELLYSLKEQGYKYNQEYSFGHPDGNCALSIFTEKHYPDAYYDINSILTSDDFDVNDWNKTPYYEIIGYCEKKYGINISKYAKNYFNLSEFENDYLFSYISGIQIAAKILELKVETQFDIISTIERFITIKKLKLEEYDEENK